jgi:hypothetical protein
LLGVKEDEGKLKDTKTPRREKPGDGGQKQKAAAGADRTGAGAYGEGQAVRGLGGPELTHLDGF